MTKKFLSLSIAISMMLPFTVITSDAQGKDIASAMDNAIDEATAKVEADKAVKEANAKADAANAKADAANEAADAAAAEASSAENARDDAARAHDDAVRARDAAGDNATQDLHDAVSVAYEVYRDSTFTAAEANREAREAEAAAETARAEADQAEASANYEARQALHSEPMTLPLRQEMPRVPMLPKLITMLLMLPGTSIRNLL